MNKINTVFFTASVLTGACAPPRAVVTNQPYQDYAQQNYTAIGNTSANSTSGSAESGGTISSTELDANGCVDVVNGQCVKLTRSGAYCEGATSGPVDTVVVDGVVKATVCYPSPEESKRPVEVTDVSEAPNVAKTANGTAIIFDPATDGKPIAGPLEISANNVSIFGNGPDKTIIDGDVRLAKNGARLRGVRIKGNLIVEFNNVSVVLCQVDGDIITEKNNGLFASNVVFGKVQANGNNNQFYFNKIAGTFSAKAEASACSDNVSFTDGNDDKVVDDAELGAAIECQ